MTSHEQIVDRICSNVQNGSIILLHNGGSETMLALPKIIENLQSRGFEFVTITQLLNTNEKKIN